MLLAAGFSARFGTDKRVARLAEGDTLLERSLRVWVEALGPVSVALRAEDAALALRVEALGGHPLSCTRSEEGLGATLAQAAAQLPPGPVLVGLADMPFVQPQTLRALARRLEDGAEIVAPYFGERRGNPVGFAAARRELLLGLSGDRGAGALLHALPLERVAVEDAGVLLDIDRPGDLEAGTGG
ncbi:nucleotidyltransferase family protein [Azohydromonas caseinilytica]|uniref:Nucleotidyltransferase family protein n=1 Tax=Azohydromonas caseinilytica TaxID=2728836 RepID=A0A848F3Z1_9BURK|nr:nucleotidyltransferase family protein [Azohydromonas caseinilytica]NML14102.1 nucleotidyltransferase family protein [Azohydromonas caseinilytica]